MFFLMRSAFWLGLVFWVLGPRTIDVDAGVRSAGDMAGSALTQACSGDRLATCLDVAAKVSTLAGPLPGLPAHVAPSGHALTGADLLPPWQGAPRKAQPKN